MKGARYKMLLSEEKAKTLWCPMARSASIETTGPAGHALNAIAANDGQACRASGCMMWRWGAMPTEFNIDCIHFRDEGMAVVSNGYCHICGSEGYREPVPEQQPGYCGLAGLPVW